MQIIKKVLSILLRIGISILLLVFIFRQIDEKALLAIIKHVNKPLLIFSFLIFGISYLLAFWRWRMLLEAVNIKVALKRVFISFSGGIFFNVFLPSTIGGDFVRTLDLCAHTGKPRQIIATVFLDRLSGYVGLVFISLASVFFGWNIIRDKSVFVSIFIITLILIAILLVLFNSWIFSRLNAFLNSPLSGNRIKELLGDLQEEIHHFKNKKKVIMKNLILSLFIQFISPLTFYLIALSIGVKINIAYFFIFLPIIGAITLLPVSIGGLGLRDASTIILFAKAGVAKDLAFAMSLLSFVFIIIYAGLGGLVYVLTVHHRRVQSDSSSSVCEDP